MFSVILFSCEEEDNSRYNSTPETGWIEFETAATIIGETDESVTIPINVEVPIYKEGLNITYTITGVEGDFTTFVSDTGGNIFADPLDYSRTINVDIPLKNTAAGRDFITTFDVKLTAIDKSGIRLGINSDSVLTHRVTIPCLNPAVIPADFFTGSYTIADVSANVGPENGTENFAGGAVKLSVDPTNANAREFRSGVLPAFNAEIEIINITFVTGDNVVTLGDVDPNLSCDGTTLYIYTAESTANNTPWDICAGDNSILINYVEDPNASCGGPYMSSFSLTKI